MKQLIIVIYAIPALAIVAISAIMKSPLLVLIWGVFLGGFVVVVTSVLIGFSIKTRRKLAPSAASLLVYWLIFVSAAAVNWPFRLRFFLSRPSIERVAAQVTAGKSPTTPFRAGAFWIEQAELRRDGIVCLWTVPNPGGSTGFVHCRGETVPFNLFTCIDLDGRWRYIEED